MAWHCVNQTRPEDHCNRWNSSESNTIWPFSWPTALTSNESAHSEPLKCVLRAIPYWNPFTPLPKTGTVCFEFDYINWKNKYYIANKINFAVSKIENISSTKTYPDELRRRLCSKWRRKVATLVMDNCWISPVLYWAILDDRGKNGHRRTTM